MNVAAADTPSQRNRNPIQRTRSKPTALIATALACVALIVWGFARRSQSDLSAEEGIGYGLGIAGLSMMTLLLTYSLRKRMPKWLGRISIRRWFEVHMMLGLAGPTAILFHCNFKLGSLNSTVALFSMLIVAASGIAGRFMYTKIHHGLLGERATLSELHDVIRAQRQALAVLPAHTPAADERLAAFETWALEPRRSAVSSTLRFFSLGPRTHSALRSSLRGRRAGSSRADIRDYRAALKGYLRSIRRVATFTTYAWLFSLWHALHLPLCVLLFSAASVHILAVHLY